MKTAFKLVLLFTFTNSFGQFLTYLDTPGMATREVENRTAQNAYLAYLNTKRAYLATLPATSAAELSRTYMFFNLADPNTAVINYLEYGTMCNSYLNPFKKKTCLNRLNYLKSAHIQVLQLMHVVTTSRVNQGVKELIGEKYTRITNTIYRELEEMKMKAEESMFTHIFLD